MTISNLIEKANKTNKEWSELKETSGVRTAMLTGNVGVAFRTLKKIVKQTSNDSIRVYQMESNGKYVAQYK